MQGGYDEESFLCDRMKYGVFLFFLLFFCESCFQKSSRMLDSNRKDKVLVKKSEKILAVEVLV